MAASYTLNFSDPSNTPGIVVTSTTDGPGINNYDTSLDLVGAGYQNYGLPTAQNFLKLLENFAGPNQPLHAIKGQLWYDTGASKPVLRINNGQVTSARWPSANGIYQQTSDPVIRYSTNIVEGDVWVDTSANQLKIRFNNEWTIVGPTVQVGTYKTGSEAIEVESTTGTAYPIIKNWVNGKVIEIISYNAFTPRTVIDGFATIKIGTNLTTRVVAKYNGLAEKASALEVSSGVLIKASEVLKNNAATQTLAGTLIIESVNGLSVRQNSTSDPVKISNSGNAASIDFVTAVSAATLKVGVQSASYLKFDSAPGTTRPSGSIGINKTPDPSSPTLDVSGGARFVNTVTITTSSAIALSVGGGASFGGSISSIGLSVVGTITGTGKVTVGGPEVAVDGIVIEPTDDITYDIGSSSKKFREIWASDFHATTYHGEFTGAASSLTNARSFNITGQVTATSVTFNGTIPVTFDTTLTRDAIDGHDPVYTPVATHTLLVLDTSTTTTTLEKISKSDFLSDVYPSLFVSGMITAFGTSTSIPSGFLMCDGVSYSAITYSTLFAVIAESYGTAGAGTFRVPNMTTSTSVAPGGYLTYIIKT